MILSHRITSNPIKSI